MSSAWDGLLNTPEVTELPHYAFGKKTPEDAYFTRRDVAKHCMNRLKAVCCKRGIDLGGYTFVEPSAGEGCFYDHFPLDADKIGIDISPKRNHFVRADYLRWWPKRIERKYVVIGNPPFGHRGALALAFINRSLLFADMVAFILPMSFYTNGKGTNMKRVQGATLLHNEELGRESFYDPGTGEPVAVNTLFQVWHKGKHQSVFNDYDVSEYVDIFTCCSAPNRYCGLGRGRTYDCFIASTFYRDDIGIVPTFDQVKYGSGYGIIIKRDKQAVIASLKRANWFKHSSAATNSCRHIRMFHIREILGHSGFGRRL